MLKASCALTGIALTIALVICCCGVPTQTPTHTHLLADGGQPPPDIICFPPLIPCPPSRPQGRAQQLQGAPLTVSPDSPVVLARGDDVLLYHRV